MNLFNLFKIAWKALNRNKMRSFLTMLGIIIGVASVIAMMAIGEGSKKSIEEQIAGMGSNMLNVRPNSRNQGGIQMENTSSQKLTMADYNFIKNNSKTLRHFSPQVSKKGQAIYQTNNWPTSVHGVGPEYLDIRTISVASGAMFTEAQVSSSAKVALLGKTVVDNLFLNGEDPVGQIVRFERIPFKVVGTLGKKGESTFGQDQDDIILVPYTTAQKKLMAVTHIQSIYVSAKSKELAVEAVDELTSLLRISHKLKDSEEDDFQVRSQQELITTFSATSKILSVLLVAIAGISLFVGGIGIMNIMYVSVTERTREIGLRMAVGARPSDILWQFLVESIILSVVGGVIGVGLGIGSSWVVSAYLGWPTEITGTSIYLAFTVCVVTGAFFGWYPAKRASKMDPINALRYE